MKTPILIAAALVGWSASALAQGSIHDQGSFTISVNGRTAGRENFRISAMTRGDVSEYVARADITYGDRRVSPELRTTSDGTVVDYKVTSRSGATAESWEGGVASGRLTATIKSGRGTAAREYVVPAGTIVLDDEIVHHHWFLVNRSRNGAIPVVLPRRTSVQATVTMSVVGEETLQVGNHDLAATHLQATIAGEVHDIWVDKAGRLLKVALPARGLIAIRDDPPRA